MRLKSKFKIDILMATIKILKECPNGEKHEHITQYGFDPMGICDKCNLVDIEYYINDYIDKLKGEKIDKNIIGGERMNNISVVVKNSKCLNENPNCKNEHEFVPIGNRKYFEMRCINK